MVRLAVGLFVGLRLRSMSRNLKALSRFKTEMLDIDLPVALHKASLSSVDAARLSILFDMILRQMMAEVKSGDSFVNSGIKT